jgi:HPt (histidine-containing phosphotransfer) domain-containing protein
MDDHVAKPIEPQELFQALLKWVKPREGAAAEADAEGLPAAAEKPAEDAGPKLPRGIEGLDTELGLRRVLGKVSRYLSMLEKYVAGQKGAITEMRQAIAAGDRDTALRLAHTTKGVSGNIGAQVVQRLAETLEQALKDGAPMDGMPALVDALQEQLDPLVAAITDQLPKTSVAASASGPVAIDEGQLTEVTDRLRSLLEEMDSDASEWIQAHQVLLSAAYPKHTKAVQEALEGFDFDVALEQLDAAVAARKGA